MQFSIIYIMRMAGIVELLQSGRPLRGLMVEKPVLRAPGARGEHATGRNARI